tara:strand:+ start:63 stop:581 length:519 start_codon:yes stop_codon:yes gene_type:complete
MLEGLSMKIRVAFYKGTGDWRNKIIRWWTKSPYSHAELVLPDDKTWVGISPFLSSRVAERDNSCYDKSKWDFIDFTITEEQYKIILNFIEDTKGCKYDWFGMLLSQLLPFHIKQREKWYCSEWIAYALRIAGVINWRVIKIYDRCDLSPGVLYGISRQIANINNIKEKYGSE